MSFLFLQYSHDNTDYHPVLHTPYDEMVSGWLIWNKLSLHLEKTKFILFASKSRLKSQSNMTISCHTNVMETKTQVKYLGATLDQTLSCDGMVLSIIQNLLYRKLMPG